jgi:hypothetical protein
VTVLWAECPLGPLICTVYMFALQGMLATMGKDKRKCWRGCMMLQSAASLSKCP